MAIYGLTIHFTLCNGLKKKKKKLVPLIHSSILVSFILCILVLDGSSVYYDQHTH